MGRQERLVRDALPIALARPEFFTPQVLPAYLFSFPPLSWCWGLNPVSCARQSGALPLSYQVLENVGLDPPPYLVMFLSLFFFRQVLM